MAISTKITSLNNISFSKIFKVFKHTNTIENDIQLGDFIKNDTIVYNVPENYNIPATKNNIELRIFLNSIYVTPYKSIDITISNSYINSKIITGTNYINNFNLYNYLQTLDIYNFNSSILELNITLNLSNYQFVDNTFNGAFVINIDNFTTSFNNLNKLIITNNMYITGNHGSGSGNSTATSGYDGGDGENATNGGDAVVINTTQVSSIAIEIIDQNQRIIGGFGAQGGNGGNGGRKTVYLYYYDTDRIYPVKEASGGTGGTINLKYRDNWTETINNPYHPHAEDGNYHIIRSGEYITWGIYINPISLNFLLYYTQTYTTTTLARAETHFQNSKNPTNGTSTTNPSIGVHNASNRFSRNTPSNGTKTLVDGYYNDSWSGKEGTAGTNGSDGNIFKYNHSHINVDYSI
jgi:hypothetical protein